MKKVLASFIFAMAIACSFVNTADAAIPLENLEKAFQSARAQNTPIKAMVVFTAEDFRNLKNIISSNGAVIVGEFKARIPSKPANIETDGYKYSVSFK